ncbi:MAG: acyl-CoA dehydrogenase family protein [Acidimicrobiia bacterium]|nr:acyl-CoA dehydrogenase family protein [Acidimicrobiia bacterium]
MTQRPSPEAARLDHAAWRARSVFDPYTTDHHLRALADHSLSGVRRADVDAIGREFGASMVAMVSPAVAAYQHHPPRLEKYDGSGERVERVIFTSDYERAGAVLWDAGLVARSASAGGSFEQFVLLYLTSLEGEMGHMCPATCTTGLIRVLRRAASPELQAAFLPRLTEYDYSQAWRGAQFLTEVQGGSDVGANAVRAAPSGDGTYRITGEKWFCSVADADVFLITARPDAADSGTAGLGTFVVPRLIDGKPNGFSIRRLKDKLGTTSMASAEIDFDGAVAYPVGDVSDGFKIMVSAMLNTSRWMNAIGNVGIMRRAYTEAVGYAAHRRAFGQTIGSFPLVRHQLATMKVRWLAALHSTWALTALDEAVDVDAMGGAPAETDDVAFHRFLVNANKLECSVSATDLVRSAIEILGGNGAIEDFSVLPRLLRDCVVYEQWEGTHNVLTAQVLRDMGRLGLAGVVVDRIGRTLKSIADPERGAIAQVAEAALEDLVGRITRSVEDTAYGALHFREHLVALVRSFQVAHMLEVAENFRPGPVADELTAAAGLLASTTLDPEYVPGDDPLLLDRVDACLGEDGGVSRQ